MTVKTKNHIDILIGKVVSGNAGPGEQEELNELLRSSEEVRILFEESRKAWEKGVTHIPQSLLDGDKTRLRAEYCRHLSEKVRRSGRRLLIYKIAAMLALPIGLAVGFYLLDRSPSYSSDVPNLCEVAAPSGNICSCILPDGTKVWVNAGSSATYDIADFNRRSRTVSISGEAYFEVAANEKKPFRVITPYADIKVTGTAFNVSSCTETQRFEVVLSEGTIELQFKEGAMKSYSLKSNQRLIYFAMNDEIDLLTVDPRLFTSWRNGELIFKDATLNDIIAELERIYNISFHLTPASIGEMRFRGMFSYNNNLIEALEKINKTSGISYYIKENEVWLTKTN